MKYLHFIFLSLLFINCNNEVQEDSEMKIEAGKFLWTAEWTNGVQGDPKDMTKTVYTFLAVNNTKNALCYKDNIAVPTVYKEIWTNDNTKEKPVWRLNKSKNEVMDYSDAMPIVCERKDVTYAIADLNKFNLPLDRYPLFKTKKE